MIDWVTHWRPIFETMYFIASIGLFATVIIGLYQIKLLKKDIGDRNKRAAVEKSIEYLNWFATGFIPSFEEYVIRINQAGVIKHDGPYTEFIFTPDFNVHIANVKDSLDKFKENNGLSLANELEFFAAALRSGLADEELVYNPIAEFYCNSIETFYVGYCEYRKDSESPLFTNSVQLYMMWKGRLNKSKEDKEKKRHDVSSSMSNKRIRSIGS